ncbi:MAG: DUF309 domain-containing protein [Candidatus Lambdaproteobacteria bacterium]|nr:DUF309 domain-containing protein [Candidatus Lambdaproteobacteria bacterium]
MAWLAAQPGPPARGAARLFRHGLALFDGGYYWEAHECWEALWRSERRGAPRRHLLQGLILLAAAQVKALQGQPAGRARLMARAIERLAEAHGCAEPARRLSGVDTARLLARCSAWCAALRSERGAGSAGAPPRLGQE